MNRAQRRQAARDQQRRGSTWVKWEPIPLTFSDQAERLARICQVELDWQIKPGYVMPLTPTVDHGWPWHFDYFAQLIPEPPFTHVATPVADDAHRFESVKYDDTAEQCTQPHPDLRPDQPADYATCERRAGHEGPHWINRDLAFCPGCFYAGGDYCADPCPLTPYVLDNLHAQPDSWTWTDERNETIQNSIDSLAALCAGNERFQKDRQAVEHNER